MMLQICDPSTQMSRMSASVKAEKIVNMQYLSNIVIIDTLNPEIKILKPEKSSTPKKSQK